MSSHPHQQQSRPSSDPQVPSDKDLLDLLNSMDTFNPIIPEALLDHYFIRAGVDCDDTRIKKLVALVAQKFITDVAQDAVQYSRVRSGAGASSAAQTSGGARTGATGRRTVLTLEDLTAALSERGIDVRRPPYHM
jgi:transcription initiation factor TFIID subunit 10